MKQIALVMLGGGLGSVCRYLTGIFVKKIITGDFPWGTFLINVGGSLLIGLVMSYCSRKGHAAETGSLLLATGFCGGFTTFSAFALENMRLLQSGHTAQALLYATLSIVLGVLSVWVGLSAGKAFFS